MKRINFSKVKKGLQSFIKNLAFWNKKKYSEQAIKTDEQKAPSGNYNYRKGGFKYYTHRLMPINKDKSIVYRSFNKHKLIGAIMIIGKIHYRIEKNPYFAS